MTSQDLLKSLLANAETHAQQSAQEALRPLLNYDQAHGGDLINTLRVYLAAGCNASRAAEDLFLHRSGLRYRLDRIETLLGVRLDSFEIRVALELAVLSLVSSGERALHS